MSETVIVQNKAPARLVCAKDDAVRLLRARYEAGSALAAMRIRNPGDLDRARALKLEWTTEVAQTLTDLFDNTTVAEECNDWVGRIYPEYAEFGNFVEQFYAEMNHRLQRLKGVLKRVEKMGTTIRAIANEQAAKTEPKAPPPAPRGSSRGLLVCCAQSPARQPLADFFAQLDVAVACVEAADGATLAQSLDQHNDAAFAVLVQDGSPGPSPFELGFCVGRLGLKRVCVMHANGSELATDTYGLMHLSIDLNGGWQLHLAKHLKRAGLAVDLNRLA